MKWIVLIYAVMSLVAFVAMWLDKRRAVKSKSRISEKTLHILELACGWPGSLLAQIVIRHKNRKLSYQVVFWGIVVLHIAGWAAWIWFMVDGSGVDAGGDATGA